MANPSSTDIKHLFIQHLAERLEQMECAAVPMQPIAYRLYARRLREALAGYPAGRLAGQLARRYPAVAEALACRHFDSHGFLLGTHAAQARVIGEDAMLRMKQPAR
jgi:hypothetical protein